MKTITKQIPNALTCLNLFMGCVGCVFAFLGEFQSAAICLLLAAIFDFSDGLAARVLNAFSKIGKELDSLADMVSFGVLPGMMLFCYFSNELDMGIYSVAAFAIPVFSAIRLAKFNIDTRQTTSFLGLPTPANAIFWAFSVVSMSGSISAFDPVISFIILVSIEAIFCLLLLAEIPMFSLKFKNFSWKNNKTQIIFLTVSLFLLIFLQFTAFPAIIGLYIILSLVHDKLL